MCNAESCVIRSHEVQRFDVICRRGVRPYARYGVDHMRPTTFDHTQRGVRGHRPRRISLECKEVAETL